MRDLINIMEALAHNEASQMDAIMDNIATAREGLRAWRAKHHLDLARMPTEAYDAHPIVMVAHALDMAAASLKEYINSDSAIDKPVLSDLRPDLTISHGVVVGGKHMVQANTSAGMEFMKSHFGNDKIATLGELAMQNLIKSAEMANLSIRHMD